MNVLFSETRVIVLSLLAYFLLNDLHPGCSNITRGESCLYKRFN